MLVLGKGGSTGSVARSADLGGVIVSTTHYAGGDVSHDMHYHENPHICFILQGGDVEWRSGESYERVTGDAHFYGAGEKHASVSRPALTRNTNIEFCPEYMSRNDLTESRIRDAIEKNPHARFLILKLQSEMIDDDRDSRLSANALLLDLLGPSGYGVRETPLWASAVEEILREKWDEPVTLDELSNATQKYPTTISKHFRHIFGCTLGEYRRKIRIEKSLSLIKDTEMPLTDIALHCGFSDQSHFTRTFKAMTGMLPKQFRHF